MTTPTQVPCLICQHPLSLRPARGRKSGKPSLMLICPVDGRHFRGFVNYQPYVAQVSALLESRTQSSDGGADVDDDPTPENPSKIVLEGLSRGELHSTLSLSSNDAVWPSRESSTRRTKAGLLIRARKSLPSLGQARDRDTFPLLLVLVVTFRTAPQTAQVVQNLG